MARVTETVTRIICDIEGCGKEATSKCPGCGLDVCGDHSSLWTGEFPKIWLNLCIYCKPKFLEGVASLVSSYGGTVPRYFVMSRD